jgi:hypothetical protein
MKFKLFGITIDFKRTVKEKATEVKTLKEQWEEIDNKKAPSAATAEKTPIRKNARFRGSAELEQKIRNRIRKMYLQDKMNYADIVKYTHTSTAFVSSCIEPHEKRGRGRKDKSAAYADRIISRLEEKSTDI